MLTTPSGGGVDPTELDFVPKAATYSGESDEYTDGHGVNAKKITLDENISSVFIYPYALGERNGNPCTIGKENGAGTMLITKYNSTVYGILTTGGGSSHQFLYTYYDGDWHGTTVSTNGIGTDYWTEIIGGEYITQVPTSAASPIGVSPQDMQNAGDNTVTVIWNRPGDNKVLTDTFEITVSQ